MHPMRPSSATNGQAWHGPPSLACLCTRVLFQHLHRICYDDMHGDGAWVGLGYVGDVRFELIAPIVRQFHLEQLLLFDAYNPVCCIPFKDDTSW